MKASIQTDAVGTGVTIVATEGALTNVTARSSKRF